MGRSRNHHGQFVAEDLGEPGKFYFGYPEVIEIKGKPMPQQTTTSTALSVDRAPHSVDPTMCRLKSSYDFNGYLPPLNIEYECGRFPHKEEALLYIRDAHVMGYGEGAIVTRKYQPKGYHKQQFRWGIILLEHKHHSNGATPWSPFTVKWFDPARSIEPAWREDLILIHPMLQEDILDDILEAQSVDK
jgi:hypothetical protein